MLLNPKKKKSSGQVYATLSKLKIDKNGLIPAIIQDARTDEVLMLAYMNKLSIRRTLETGRTHFWSRSRKKLWLKGETSGNFQEVKEIYYDCDADALLVKVKQIGAACHTGNKSCFYRKIKEKGDASTFPKSLPCSTKVEASPFWR